MNTPIAEVIRLEAETKAARERAEAPVKVVAEAVRNLVLKNYRSTVSSSVASVSKSVDSGDVPAEVEWAFHVGRPITFTTYGRAYFNGVPSARARLRIRNSCTGADDHLTIPDSAVRGDVHAALAETRKAIKRHKNTVCRSKLAKEMADARAGLRKARAEVIEWEGVLDEALDKAKKSGLFADWEVRGAA